MYMYAALRVASHLDYRLVMLVGDHNLLHRTMYWAVRSMTVFRVFQLHVIKADKLTKMGPKFLYMWMMWLCSDLHFELHVIFVLIY